MQFWRSSGHPPVWLTVVPASGGLLRWSVATAASSYYVEVFDGVVVLRLRLYKLSGQRVCHWDVLAGNVYDVEVIFL